MCLCVYRNIISAAKWECLSVKWEGRFAMDIMNGIGLLWM